jgi:2',3'-cyclic-nucleotide 2'-phosphodiesterase/3'-nucleotidase
LSKVNLPVSITPGPNEIHLRLLATTDVHVQIHPYDYYADRPAPESGLALLATLISQLRAQTPNTLLLDNGDILQGSPMGCFVAEVQDPTGRAVHPAIAAMNVLGYDAATIGNHEFNYGLDFLTRSLGAAQFPIVCANVVVHEADNPADDDTLLPPYVILDRNVTDGAGKAHKLRIGVIGLLPPQIMVWDRQHLAGRVTTRDIVAAAEAWLPRITADCADLVIALCHSGIGPPEPEEGLENAATALAALSGIDALVVGHSHLVFPGPGFADLPGVDDQKGTLMGKPAVMAGSYGSHLGVIDLILQQDAGGWRVGAAQTKAIPASAANYAEVSPRATAVLAATREDHDRTVAHVRKSVGHSDVPLTTYFAALPGNAALALIARAQAWHVKSRLAGTPFGDLPLLSAASPFKMGGRGGPDFYTDIPAGPILVRHLAALYPYPNMIRAVVVTGAQLQAWLERATAGFHQIAPGRQDQLLIDASVPSSNFDVIHGVTWEVDLSQPARSGGTGEGRVRDLRHDGRPVAGEDRFVIATNNYRAAGGAAFPGSGDEIVILSEPDLTREILRRYLIETGAVRRYDRPVWRFRPMPGTSIVYETAPGARAHLHEVSPLRAEPIGETPDGFAQFRIHL